MTYLTSEQLSINAHQKEILLIIYTGADGPSRLVRPVATLTASFTQEKVPRHEVVCPI